MLLQLSLTHTQCVCVYVHTHTQCVCVCVCTYAKTDTDTDTNIKKMMPKRINLLTYCTQNQNFEILTYYSYFFMSLQMFKVLK